ncbi:hypothetical protein B2J88_46830 [Rhodococcus sp. SRB_17]|nr:hypothetical protein [Rhodococcus sp. SRB_17]
MPPRDLGEIRERLIDALQQVAGPRLTAEHAQELLEEACAWNQSGNARDLDRHLAEHSDAFTAPSPNCPLALERLLKLLTANGFGDSVVLLGCARCGRTDKLLKRRTPEGRCCERCLERVERRQCARCGKSARIVTRRSDGPICRRCYAHDPARQAKCTRCGEVRPLMARTEDGSPLCSKCTPRPEKPCVQCGRVARISANTPKGPVCKHCYRSPPRLCGICGQVRPIQRRGDGGDRPDVCYECARMGECAGCGRRRGGGRYRGGPFYCSTCWPKPQQPCAICGETKAISARWPLGSVCQRCYRSRLERPEPCADCHATRILVCVDEGGSFTCTRCGGVDLDFTCRSCGEEGPGFRDGKCNRCLVMTKIGRLLDIDDPASNSYLQPLFTALATVDPGSVHTWITNEASLALLASLAARGADIAHEKLDLLPQNARTHHIRESFVCAGILPRRNEALAQLQLWADRTISALPPQHQPLIRSYSEWHIIRRARCRAARGTFREAANRSNRQRIRCAIDFLRWLDSAGTPVGGLTQQHVDTYLDMSPANVQALFTFISWMGARGLIAGIDIVRPKDALPQEFQDEEDHAEQLRRCLTDSSLPLEIRIVGALIRLYALPVVSIVELTTDRFHREDSAAYLTVDENAVMVPPSLAVLIDELLRRSTDNVRRTNARHPAYLFPGRPSSRPRSTQVLWRQLKQHGLPTLAARNTAMIANVTHLDAVVVSDLFGVAPQTAHKWAQYASTSWATYLAAQGNPR